MGHRDRTTDVARGLAVALLCVLPFVPSLEAAYLADDWFFAAAYCRDSRSFGGLAWQALSSLEGAPTTFYRPLPFMSLALQVRLSGCDPWPLHAFNLALHGVVCLGLFWFARRLTGNWLAAAVATLLFGWFPRRVEAVAWLSCRPDLMAAAFSVASILAFGSSVQKLRKDLPTLFWWAALLSKESALLLPLVHATLAWHHEAGDRRAVVRRMLPFALSLPVFLVVRRLAIGAWAGGYGSEALAVTPATAVSAAKHLAYQVTPPLEFLEAFVRGRAGALVVGVAIMATVCGVVALAWRHRGEIATHAGLVWWLAAVLPVLTLPVSLTTTFNDRLLYLPGVGAGVLAAVALRGARSRAATWAALAVCLVLGLWSGTLASRWARAGALTSQSVAALAEALRDSTDRRIYLAAAPDSLGGAYMLRNGVREALALHGVADVSRVALLSWYFVAPAGEAHVPVRATLTPPRTLDLATVGASPQVIVGTPDARALVDYEAPGTTDRLGRRQSARIYLREPGVVWLVTPGGVAAIR